MIIDNEFKGLIPPLTDEEYKGLEESILSEGCRDALVLWGEIIVDGHNRYEICTRHNIPFKTVQKEFTSRDEVMLWMLQNQLARRNLNDFQRSEMVHKCEDAVKAKAKERQAEYYGNQYKIGQRHLDDFGGCKKHLRHCSTSGNRQGRNIFCKRKFDL